MVKLEFSISDKDFDRLMFLKNKIEKKNNLTGNEYAEQLLHYVLYNKCRSILVEQDD